MQEIQRYIDKEFKEKSFSSPQNSFSDKESKKFWPTVYFQTK